MTWDDVIQEIDAALQELADLMSTDPVYGVLYQQRMALMLFRKQEAIAAKMLDQAVTERTIGAMYVSIWDGQEIRTACRWNTEKLLALDIQMVDVPDVRVLEREYVELPDGTTVLVDSRLETEEGIPAMENPL